MSAKTPAEMRVEIELGQQILDLIAGVDERICKEVLFRTFCHVMIATVEDRDELEAVADGLPDAMRDVAEQSWDNVRRQMESAAQDLGGVN